MKGKKNNFMSFHNRRRMLMSTSTVYIGPGKPSVKTDLDGNITDYVVSEEYDVTDTGTDIEFIPFKSGSGFVLHIRRKWGQTPPITAASFRHCFTRLITRRVRHHHMRDLSSGMRNIEDPTGSGLSLAQVKQT